MANEMAQFLPWAAGTFAPWHVGQVFVGPDGKTLYQVYPDGASPTGYTLKTTDANGGVSFSPGPSPNDPNAQAEWFENSSYGQRLARAEEAQAAQNAWQRGMTEDQFNLSREIQRGQLDVSRGQLDVNRASQQSTAEYQRGLLENARAQIAATIRGQNLTAGNQALQLGASLRGPKDYFQYQQMVAGARGNPLIAGAVDTWANATQTRPTGAGAWAGGTPEPMTLPALLSDFGVGGGGQTNSSGNAVADSGGGYQVPTIQAFDEFLMNPHKSSANYLSTLDPDQLGLLQSYADAKGHSWNTVQSRYDNSRVKQGIGGSNLA